MKEMYVARTARVIRRNLDLPRLDLLRRRPQISQTFRIHGERAEL